MPKGPKAKRLQSRWELGLQEVAKLAYSDGRLGGGESGRYLLCIQGGSGSPWQGMEWEGVGSER